MSRVFPAGDKYVGSFLTILVSGWKVENDVDFQKIDLGLGKGMESSELIY